MFTHYILPPQFVVCFSASVKEDDSFGGAHAKKIADRPRGHGKGKGIGVGCAPSRAKRGSNCFKHSLKCGCVLHKVPI